MLCSAENGRLCAPFDTESFGLCRMMCLHVQLFDSRLKVVLDQRFISRHISAFCSVIVLNDV